MNIPLIVARDNDYRMENKISFVQQTGYYKRELYCGKPALGSRICIVDAIISKGYTGAEAIKAFQKAGCTIVSMLAVAYKAEYGGSDLIERQTGIVPSWVLTVKYRGLSEIIVERN